MKNKLTNVEITTYLKNLLGDEYEPFINSQPEPTAIRINTIKTSPSEFKKKLAIYHIKYKNIPFCLDGVVLDDDKLPLSHTLSFFTGEFQYQGISSQFPVMMLDLQKGDRVLDMAAAPGSKSAQIAALMENTGDLALNDNSYQRLQALNTNIQRNGIRNSYTMNFRGERLGKLFPGYFDKVLLDAPCTALGTLPNNPEINSWWSLTKLSKLKRIQQYLLVSAIKAVKVGGHIVYSTCSIAPEENELLIEDIIKNYPVEVVEIPKKLKGSFADGLDSYQDRSIDKSLKSAVRIWPQRHAMEGFFAVKLIKTAEIPDKIEKDPLPERELLCHDDLEIQPILNALTETWGISEYFWQNYRYYLTKNRIWMVSESIKKIPVTPFVSAGLLLAEKRLFYWKLLNSSVQVLNSYITNRIVALKDDELQELFANGELFGKDFDDGYYVLKYLDNMIASLYVEDRKIRIRLPHKFRLVL